MLNTHRTNVGFTLIELLVTISIISMLVIGAVAGYGNFNNKNLLKQTVLTLKNNIRLTESNASLGNKPSGCTKLSSYRITFAGSGYTMVANCTNGVIAPTVTITYPIGVTMPALPTPNPLEFYVLSKGTNISGSTPLILSGVAGTYTLDITESGDIIDTEI